MSANRSPQGAAGGPSALTQPAVRGLKWTSYGTVGSVAVQLIYTAAISRLLPPAAFGLVALGLVILRFATYFAQLGLGSALIQKRELTEEDVRTAFSVSVLLGAVVCAGFWFLAPVTAHLLDDPAITGVVRGLAFSFLFTGFGTTSLAILHRHLRFRAVAISEVTSFTLGYLVVGLGLAHAGAGVWSLVGASLAQVGLLSAMAYGATRHRLTPLFDWSRLAGLSAFGGRVSVIGFLEFWSANSDTLVVGSLLGAEALGQYNRASLLVVLPLHHLSTSVTRVLLPSFSRIQEETERVARAYVGGFAIVSAVILPVCAAIASSGPQVVSVLLGEQFAPAAQIVPYVAVAAGVGMLTHLPGVVLEARGALNRKLAIQVVHLTGMVIALAVVVTSGSTLVGFALAWSAAELLRHGLYLVAMRREFLSPLTRLGRCYFQAATLSLSVVVAMAAMGALLGGRGLPPAVLLAAKGVAGLVSYLVLVALRPGLELRREVRERHLADVAHSLVMNRKGAAGRTAAGALVAEAQVGS